MQIEWKYTVKVAIEGISKIVVPLRPDQFPEAKPREIGVVKGNQNLANSSNSIL